jgi:hypothetical protein
MLKRWKLVTSHREGSGEESRWASRGELEYFFRRPFLSVTLGTVDGHTNLPLMIINRTSSPLTARGVLYDLLAGEGIPADLTEPTAWKVS